MEIAIIMQIIQAIMDCIKERRDATIDAAAEAVHGRIVDQSRRARRGIFRAIINMIRKDEGLRGHELRDAAADTFGMLEESNEEDVASLVGDAVKALKAMAADDTLLRVAAIEGVLADREVGQ